MSRSHVFAIHNAKTDEAGQEVFNERSEFRNLTPDEENPQQLDRGTHVTMTYTSTSNPVLEKVLTILCRKRRK